MKKPVRIIATTLGLLVLSSGTASAQSKDTTLSETKAFVGGGYDVFLKYNSRRLMKIASGRDAAQKQWLKQFLDDCEDTAEKRTLLQALQP
jgi:hypothetical protein